jgi:FtsH-binding integral membrane protein
MVGLALDQHPRVSHGHPVDFSATQQAWARTLAALWLVLGIVGLVLGILSLHYAAKPVDRGLTFAVLATSAAVPIMFYLLVTSGYFADYP